MKNIHLLARVAFKKTFSKRYVWGGNLLSKRSTVYRNFDDQLGKEYYFLLVEDHGKRVCLSKYMNLGGCNRNNSKAL